MSQNKLLSLLGIARKAGKLSLGNDPSQETMRSGQTHLLLLASDLSQRTFKGIVHTAEQEMTEVLTMDNTMDEIEAALGKRVGIIAVNDAGFAKKLRTLCGEMEKKERQEEEMSL